MGKHQFGIRELHISNHLVPLMASKSVGAAKLDLVLRGVALLAKHAGAREPGFVLRRYSWEQLYDLARLPLGIGSTPLEFDLPAATIRLKRKWVGQQLAKLEGFNLLRRHNRPGVRPKLVVLSDDGSGRPFDDPDGSPGNSYLRIPGGVIASGALARWGAPELSFFLAALIGERHEAFRRFGGGQPKWKLGGGEWFRPLNWFADEQGMRPDTHVRIPFSVPTLERGLTKHLRSGLVTREHKRLNPHNGTRLSQVRNVYSNHFDTLDNVKLQLTPNAYAAELLDDNIEQE